jgi:protoporphyrinogen IX oxidase
MVSWFAALFYMPRLLIYHVEAQSKPENERAILSAQLKIMQTRLWNYIGWPAMILTWVFGLWTSFTNPSYYYTEAWFILKLAFVLGLTLYHFQTTALYKKQQKDIFPWQSFYLRLWNEVATVILVAITFLAVPKKNSGWVWGGLALVLFAITLYAATKIYKHNREKNEAPKDPEA